MLVNLGGSFQMLQVQFPGFRFILRFRKTHEMAEEKISAMSTFSVLAFVASSVLESLHVLSKMAFKNR